MAKKSQQSTAVTKWDEEFANLAKKANKGFELPAAKFISFKSGVMTYSGAKIPDNELRCIVVGAVHENQYFDPDTPYDPESPNVPVCYAFAEEKSELTPHEKCEQPQNVEGCSTCPMNEWGSAERGDGKACKNVLRLAIIASDDAEDISGAEVVYVKVPVMSVKNWAMYIKKKIEPLSRPYWSVVTKMSLVPDAKSQFRVQFDFDEKIEDGKLFGPLKDLWEKTMEGIDFPYIVAADRAVKKVKKEKPAKGGKFARR